MRTHSKFLNAAEDCTWLIETHLKGVHLGDWRTFRSFELFGNEDSPSRVHLYMAVTPYYQDPYFEVQFSRGKVRSCCTIIG